MTARRASNAPGSAPTSRSTISKRLPFSAPRLSLRECGSAASTRKPLPSARSSPSPGQATAGRPRAGTVSHWRVRAWRSLSPPKPTSRGAHPARRATSGTSACVSRPTFSTRRRTWPAPPSAAKPSRSSTQKSPGTSLNVACPSAAPCARGGAVASSTPSGRAIIGARGARRLRPPGPRDGRARRASRASWP